MWAKAAMVGNADRAAARCPLSPPLRRQAHRPHVHGPPVGANIFDLPLQNSAGSARNARHGAVFVRFIGYTLPESGVANEKINGIESTLRTRSSIY